MAWQGEELFGRMFGLRGIKVICLKLLDLENQVRALEGKAPVDLSKALAWIESKMEEYKSDDEGEEEE